MLSSFRAVGVSLIAIAFVSTASAQSLIPMASFGGASHPGWRAPNEILPGDSAGSNNGSTYNYLTSVAASQFERGLAYNPVTGNLILISRNGGTNVRVLNGTTGADLRPLDVTGISGGTFTVSMTRVDSTGKVYASNLTTNASTTPHKIYQWADDSGSGAPTTFSSTLYSTAPSTFLTQTNTSVAARLGDTLDLIGSGANTVLVAGAGNVVGYATVTTADGITGTGSYATLGATPPNNSALQQGITFAGSANDVWGKIAGASTRRTTYTGTTLTDLGTLSLTSTTEVAMDYATIAGVPYMATIDTGSSAAGAAGAGAVRVYDVTNPATPVLLATGNNTVGTQVTNSNRGSQVAWGDIDHDNATATLYTISANQGIQAFTFVVPEPSLLALAGVVLLATRIRR